MVVAFTTTGGSARRMARYRSHIPVVAFTSTRTIATTPALIRDVAAVAAATSTPAALLGLGDRGRLATGLRADLVVLDRAWWVRRVMRGGDWVGAPAG